MHNALYRLRFVSLAILFALSACNDDDEKLNEARARDMRTREILSNSCHEDSDCIITGCRKTLCSSMDQEEACDHRIVIALEHPEDAKRIERFVKQQLTVREAESVRLGGYAAGLWTLSFQAPMAQRERIELAVQTISMSGLSILHPNAANDSKKLFEAFEHNPDVSLKRLRGAGPLVEKQIRSGDWLSKDDIRDTWQDIAPVLKKTFDTNDIEHLWAYDIITGNIAFLRLWPIDSRTRIPLTLWREFKYHIENGDLHIEGTLSENASETLENWTRDNKMILLMLGNQVLASVLPEKTIEDGVFDIIIRSGSENHDLMDALDRLNDISMMKGTVRLDPDATARVERDIECHQKNVRECGCIEGTCGWKHSTEYNACLYKQ